MHDLLLTNARLLDPGSGLDQRGDIAFAGGKVAAIGGGLDRAQAKSVRDVGGAYVVPGLIDMHAHVYRDATALSVDADLLLRRSGTTTALDVGSAGAGNIAGLFSLVQPVTTCRLLGLVNIGHGGIFETWPGCHMPEVEDLRLLNVKACAASVRKHRPFTVGIKVRIGRSSSGTAGAAPLHMAIRAAEMAADSDHPFVPVMVHLGGELPPRLEEIVDPLRPGDILTHCCSAKDNSVVAPDGKLRDAARRAKERGVVFDIGHGMGSFGFDACARMMDQGLVPDVISSDVHVGCVDGPAYDVLVTMSKFLFLGMSLPEIVRRATTTAAKAMGWPELGVLKQGGIGDAAVLEIADRRVTLTDSMGATRVAGRHLVCRGTVAGGRWIEADPSPLPPA
ncbi:MAG: amidohydrolase/deacetylase family metallohydrolase [Acetobacteraceae bacterium]|nr:amidohydrolase/deacetylase family metallohydrolase [Acetobacteraceae bacterium]